MRNNSHKVLFEPYKLGDLTLANRIVMASLTRTRCDPETGIPTDLHVEYYSQRASAGLILTECTAISKRGDAYPGCAGIYTKEQIEGWKRVIEAVHRKGSKIFLQIWHGGRAAYTDKVTGQLPLAPSAIGIRDERWGGSGTYDVPQEMTQDDIKQALEEFRQGAINAKEAGFDGIELHAAHGYLIDTFLCDSTNHRTDEYGGSIENRSRLCLEVIDILINVFGAKRVGIKLSPVSRYQDMYDSDPISLYAYLLQELDKRGIVYVQFREPEKVVKSFYESGDKQIANVCKTFRPYFKGTIMINEKQTVETISKAVDEGYADLGCLGRNFIANPDLVERLQNEWPLNRFDWKTLYDGKEKGYTDYPTYKESDLGNTP